MQLAAIFAEFVLELDQYDRSLLSLHSVATFP